MILTLITRSFIIYILVLILLRIMGKRQIGEMQPFELVITLIIADLATVPMADITLPILHGIIPIITLGIIHFILTFLTLKSLFLRRLINGNPIIVVDPNGVNYNSLKRLNMNFNDLIENLHNAGYFDLEEVLYAIVQTNGTLSVLPRSAYAPLTADSVKLKVDQASLPIIMISEGKMVKENLKLSGLTAKFLHDEFEKITLEPKDVIFASINTEGKMYVQPKKSSFVIINTDFNGENKW